MANVWTPAGDAGVKHEVDPISRIEGHLGVKVSVTGGKIVDANAHGNLWRGFENFLLGRDINDAITFVQRICGVCPVPHGLASTHAVDTVIGYSRGHITFKTALEAAGSYGAAGTYGIPEKAVLIRNLVLGAEFLMSSITHFYHLAAPSYVQGPGIPPWTPFFDNSYYAAPLRNPGGTTALPRVANTPAEPQRLWDAVIFSYVKALKIRRMTFEAAALFAGRMPMTSCYVGGGVSNNGQENLTVKINQYRAIIKDVAAFVIAEYIPIALALGALYPNFDHQGTGSEGVIQPAVNGNPRGSGAGVGRFLSWGAFPGTDAAGTLLLPGGVKDTNTAGTNDVTHFTVLNKNDVYTKFLAGGTFSVPVNLTEEITNSRYGVAADDAAVYAASVNGKIAYPGAVARTRPVRLNGYSYMKSPRWAGTSCEVGPLARMVVAGYYPTDGTTSVVTTFPLAEAIYCVGGSIANGVDLSVLDSSIINGLSNTNLDGTVAFGAGNLAGAVVAFIAGLTGGLSTIDRLRARALESAVICLGILGSPTKVVAAHSTFTWDDTGWLGKLAALTGSALLDTAGSTWTQKAVPLTVKQGWGATEAPRGALMHQATIKAGKIQKYQCIVPTTWNGSPKDNAGNRGAIEEAMIGAAFSTAGASFTGQTGATVTTSGGVEVLRIAQSFDPCIACAIH